MEVCVKSVLVEKYQEKLRSVVWRRFCMNDVEFAYS